MAHQTEKRNGKEKDRRIGHCLLCQKPQEVLSAHLARVCMKDSTKEEREAELKRAKKSTKSWTRQGRNWDYRQICSIVMDRASRMALVRHLQERDFFISYTPEEADGVVLEQQPGPGAAVAKGEPTVASGTTMDAVEDSPWSDHDEENDASEAPTYQEAASASWGRARCNMQQTGLYEKFNSDNPLLVEFKKYLVNHMEVPNCQQEVDNVSRMLRYIQPTGEEIDMDFLRKGTEAKDYIESLKGAKLLPPTILNYINNMIHFVQFLATRNIDDMEFYTRCDSYISLLHTLRKPVSKAINKVTCKTRYQRFLGSPKSVRDCQKLLSVAKNDMLRIFANLQEGRFVGSDEKTLYRYYCEAILILGHFQRPAALQGMTVSEWLNKTHVNGRVCVAVGQHKTSSVEIATFALTTEESAFIDAYYLYIRSGLVHESVDGGRFFLGANGRPIRSPTHDVGRLHIHYKLPNVTSQEIRGVVETEVSRTFSEEQKGRVAHYVSHSTPVANVHDSMKTPEAIVATANVLSSLAGYSSDEPADGMVGRGQKRAREASEEDSATWRDFAQFLEVFPVTLTGPPPTTRQRAEAGFPQDRVFYDKWRGVQFAKREEYLLSKFYRHTPTVEKVARMISCEGWTANHPNPENVVAKCRLL
ncbi:uncharacterized protein LOC113157682 isoform X1 [Anabas testudineus]|nr:uncharacterized protein LOC113157682 isoform X1 [Anabas testudineus]